MKRPYANWLAQKGRAISARPAHSRNFLRLRGGGPDLDLARACALKEPQHRIDNRGIPLRSAAGFQNFQGLPGRDRFAVWPLADHRVERVRDSNHACLERNIFARQTIGVTGTVPTLVVRSHDEGASG